MQSTHTLSRSKLFLATLLAGSALSGSLAHAAAPLTAMQVIPVPANATDPTVPHLNYNGRPTTFKAIARHGLYDVTPGNATYTVDWDFTGDGTYDRTTTTTNRYDLETTFTYPDQVINTTFNAKIRVTRTVGANPAEVVIVTYPVLINATLPKTPDTATSHQLQLMRRAQNDDAMWYLHKQMNRTGSEDDTTTGSMITGYMTSASSQTSATNAGALWAWNLNGHYVAYPSVSYQGAWPSQARQTENDLRWNTDPYAEDAARIINYQLSTVASIVTVTAADESNLVGEPEVATPRIAGTTDLHGIYLGYNSSDQTIYPMGHNLAAFSTGHLTGLYAQVGDTTYIKGKPYENIIQQMVDAVIWAQNDSGVNIGSWYYTPNSVLDMSTTLWGITGLWHAEQFMGSSGVVVNNLGKYRLANLANDAHDPPNAVNGEKCAGYTYTQYCGFTLTFGPIYALGWLGANQFSASDATVPYPGYSTLTKGQLRTAYDNFRKFTDSRWTTWDYNGVNGVSSVFSNGLWPSSGNHWLDKGHQDNTYAMLHSQHAARAHNPFLVSYGTNDWLDEYSIYMVNNQNADGSSYTTNGNWSSETSAQVQLSTAWSVLILAPVPPAPTWLFPTDATTISPSGKTFSIANSSDPSDPNFDPTLVTYDFQLATNSTFTTILQAATKVTPGTSATTLWQITQTLTLGSSYCARTRAVTPLASSNYVTSCFTVGNVTDPPTAPTWVFPSPGENISKSAAIFIVGNANDPENPTATITYDFQMATDSTFGTILQQASGLAQGNGNTNWPINPSLVANTQYCARSRAVAGGLASAWTVSCFTAANINDPPTAPLLAAPINNASIGSLQPNLIWYSAIDPDNDPITYNVSVMKGITVVASGTAVNGTFFTVPSPLVDGTQYTWTVQAVDSHGLAGPNSLTGTFSVSLASGNNGDSDDDGLLDAWELTNFGNLLQNAWGDPDGDGRTNGEEEAEGTDPNVYNGPSVPVATCTSPLATLTPTLSVADASNVGITATRTYDFEVFAEPTLDTRVAYVMSLAEGVTNTTWTVTPALLEDHTYYWRVRAKDIHVAGQWSTPCAIVINTGNNAPGSPSNLTPPTGAVVAGSPTLTITNATDPEGNPVSYTFQLYSDAALSQLVATSAPISAGVATTSWAALPALVEDQTYYWRAFGTDSLGAAGAASVATTFTFNAVNNPPSVPVPLSPANGAKSGTLTPTLIALTSVDPDHTALTYRFELDVNATFATGALQTAAAIAPPPNSNIVTWVPPVALTENQNYCWRIRATDGVNTTVFNTTCFLANTVNDAPSVPVNLTPANNATVAIAQPQLTWSVSTDPEGDPITYTVTAKNSSNAIVSTVSGITGNTTILPFTFADTQTYTWTVVASDNGGAASAASTATAFKIALVPLDADHDGLPDAWEITYFGNITAQDGFGDPDGDGRNNAQEFAQGTNPTIYDGPSIPAATCVASLASLTPDLTVTNATQDVPGARTYAFEVYADAALNTRVAATSGVAEGVGSTTWTVAPALLEDHTYYWRARAADPFVAGGWSATCATFVSSTNNPPGMALNLTPLNGATALASPTLTVGNTTDPEGDAITYQFFVATDAAFTQPVANSAAIAAGTGTTSWALPPGTLNNDTTYFWRAIATDVNGASGVPSLATSFFFNSVNVPPSIPVPLSPINGARSGTLSPTLIALTSVDPDNNPLTYSFQLDTDATFATPALQVITGVLPNSNTVSWAPPLPLVENQTYCWRVNAFDGVNTTPWNTTCFLADSTDQPPSTPVNLTPANGLKIAVTQPQLTWSASSDPEGDRITYTVTAYDSTLAAVSTVSGITGTNTILPFAFVDGQTYTWSVTASDNGGASGAPSTATSFTIALVPLDADHDGLPDAWEITYFGNITAQDGFGDPDGDGRTNAQELAQGTNPTIYDGPTAPTATCVATLSSLTPDLTVTNATSDIPATRTYEFDIYADAGLNTRVGFATGLAEGAGTTTWTVAPALLEDHTYYWRARARDQWVAGAWTPACSIFVSASNSPPTAPTLISPLAGVVVGNTPTLTAGNATDPEGDAITYTFELYANAGLTTLLSASLPVAQGTPTTSWTVVTPLPENATIWWRVKGTDANGLDGPYSATGSFFVSGVNSPPTAPTILYPQNGTQVSLLQPVITVLDAMDPDRDALFYDFELDVEGGNFTSPALQTGMLVPQTVSTTSWLVPAPLTEDQRYCVRVRANDNLGGTSLWDQSCFLVSALNNAPSTPVLLSPTDLSTVLVTRPQLAWKPAQDPEGDPITYTVEIDDTTGAVVATATLLTANIITLPVDLVNGQTYQWRVRAVDNGGNAGNWSPKNTFTVEVTDADGDGLPDSWEIRYFGSITAQDGFGDPDGDGRINLRELQMGTDPTVYDGPQAPPALCNAIVNSLTPDLTVTDVTSLTGPRVYAFEVYADATLTTRVAYTSPGIAEMANITFWTVSTPLTENTTYYWRSRVTDPYVSGDWSPTCTMFVNSVNDPPTAPRISTPADGDLVRAQPSLTVDNATDPEGDALTYTYELYADQAMTNLVTSSSGVVSGTITTTWNGVPVLGEDTWYYWRVKATDIHGLDGPWSATGSFFISLLNTAPTVPALITPDNNGDRVDSLRPTFVLNNSSDVDLDVLTYDIQVDTNSTFATPNLITQTGIVQGSGTTSSWEITTALKENGTYCWRARANDGLATSAYSVPACFLVSVENDPPSIPTPVNPANQAQVASRLPVFTWAAATDPDHDNVSYDVQVATQPDFNVLAAEGLQITGTSTSFGAAMQTDTLYYWRVRAVDANGLAGGWSETDTFTVVLPAPLAPDVSVDGGGPWGCSVGTGQHGGAGGALAFLAMVLAVMVWRRRS